MRSIDDGGTTYSGPVRVTLETPPIFALEKRNGILSLYAAVVHCRHADTEVFTVTLKADGTRFSETADLSALAMESRLPSSQVGNFRREIVVPTSDGFHGRYFQARIVKDIDSGGVFSYDGIDYLLIPRPELEGEFFSPASSIGYGW